MGRGEVHGAAGQQQVARILESFRKVRTKWTARIFVVVLICAIFIHVAHAFGFLEIVPHEALAITLDLVVFFAIYLLLEGFVENDKRIDEMAQDERIHHKLVGDKLRQLSAKIELTSGVESYSELGVFRTKFKRMCANFDSVVLVGEVPVDYAREVDRICREGNNNLTAVRENRLAIYRPLNTHTGGKVAELIKLLPEVQSDPIGLYHIYGFEWGSFVMGKNQRTDETEVLMNYANVDGDTLFGLHLSGGSAKIFEKAVRSQLSQIGDSGVGYPPVEIVSREQVDYIVDRKKDHQDEIHDMANRGVPLVGADSICRAMIGLVQKTNRCLQVTHLCDDDPAIMRLRDKVFKEWIGENYKAKKRKVEITRIFIVAETNYDHHVIREVREEMESNGIKVLLCPLDGLNRKFRKDFSIYDEKHLVYMDEAPSNWSGTGVAFARHTENSKWIDDYKYIFQRLQDVANRGV
ncbi:hypothetical protein ACIBJI_34075 [Nocardia sp. NPDC050408]|uniref:hypothetical protein n=1 Tax=Nocardia sp. NPDC050408 TaxID=3364319 RepID=UPI00378E1194